MIRIPATCRTSAMATFLGVVVLAGSVLAGCGSATSPKANREVKSRPAGPPRTVRVSEYSLTVRCTGATTTTTPTVVLLSGATQPLSTFSFVQNQLSDSTRVCSYDRPGEGTSSKPRSTQTLADSAAVLHELLTRLDVASRGIVLVGHSLGGLIAAKYASQYRGTHQVKALVLLDATPALLTEQVLRLIPPGAQGPAGLFRTWVAGFASGQNRERMLLSSTPVPPIGNVPLTVVRHGRPIFTDVTGYGRALEGIWSEGQRAWLNLSPLSRMVIAGRSAHAIYLDQPSLTLRVIRHALSQAG
jgi:pimeloyl-ACP methyl ester carboxylesterase